MLDALLSALGYAGDSLAKPGRAIRGLLGGRPDELAAAIPFSDSLGLTDPLRSMSGHDLLQHLGMDPGDGMGGTLAGIGVDVATDPLTYAGGALTRGLMGGRLGRRGVATAGDIYDLVSPAEREADAARAAMVDRAFPVPTAQSAPEQAGGLIDNLTGGSERIPLPMAPDPLRQLPQPHGYRALMGVDDFGAYSPDTAGYAADALQDLGPGAPDAFRTSLGAWDQVLGDLGRVHQDALLHEGLIGAGAGPRTETAADWMRHLENRAGDLRTVGYHAGEAAHPELAEAARNQLDRIHALGLGVSPHSQAQYGLQGIMSGLTRPSEVPEMLQSGGPLSHLPIDEKALRKMAALHQQDSVVSDIRGVIDALTDDGTHSVENLPGLMDPRHLAMSLKSVLDPTIMIATNGIEPGIATGLIRNPPTGPEGDMIRQVLELYNRVRSAPHLASMYPHIG